MALASVVALVATMGLNAYSGMLTVVTALNSLFGVHPDARLRLAAIIAVAAAWIAITFAITGNAIELLFATLTFMLYLLVPWTSINLADYFFVRHGRYAITHLFMPRGIYGPWGGQGTAGLRTWLHVYPAVLRAAGRLHRAGCTGTWGNRYRLADRPDRVRQRLSAAVSLTGHLE
jgi:purine-cytosine permease-like protein